MIDDINRVDFPGHGVPFFRLQARNSKSRLQVSGLVARVGNKINFTLFGMAMDGRNVRTFRRKRYIWQEAFRQRCGKLIIGFHEDSRSIGIREQSLDDLTNLLRVCFGGLVSRRKARQTVECHDRAAAFGKCFQLAHRGNRNTFDINKYDDLVFQIAKHERWTVDLAHSVEKAVVEEIEVIAGIEYGPHRTAQIPAG